MRHVPGSGEPGEGWGGDAGRRGRGGEGGGGAESYHRVVCGGLCGCRFVGVWVSGCRSDEVRGGGK